MKAVRGNDGKTNIFLPTQTNSLRPFILQLDVPLRIKGSLSVFTHCVFFIDNKYRMSLGLDSKRISSNCPNGQLFFDEKYALLYD